MKVDWREGETRNVRDREKGKGEQFEIIEEETVERKGDGKRHRKWP